MICRRCGEVLPDYSLKCPVCGELQDKSQKNDYKTRLNPRHDHEEDCNHWEDRKQSAPSSNPETARQEAAPMGFAEAVRRMLTRMLDFQGRATRREFWWGYLALMLLAALVGAMSPEVAEMASVLLLLPMLSLSVRRLHDTGRSGWWCMVQMIPGVGMVLFLVLMCLPGQGNNKWGRTP